MAKTIKTSVIISATDNMSPVVVRATNRSINSLTKLSKSAKAVASGSFATGRGSAGLAAGIAAPLIYAGKKAVDFEDEMANVAKVTDLKVGGKGIAALGENVKDLSEYLAVNAEDAAKMYANLAQGGVAKAELVSVAKRVGEIGIAYDTTADLAGDAFVKTQNALAISTKATFAVFDAVNELSDKTAAKAQELTTFLASGAASVARNYGSSGAEIAAFGATLISAGKSGEMASTIIERFAKNIHKSKEAFTAYKQAGRGTAGFMAVLAKGAQIKDIDKQSEYFAAFQEYGPEIQAMATAMNGPNGLVNALARVSDEQLYLGSVQKEAANRMSTTAFGFKSAWTGIQRSVLDAGATMLPIMNDILKDVRPIIKASGEWIRANPELTKTILKAAGGMAAFSAVISGMSFMVGGVATSIAAVTTASSWFVAGGPVAGAIAGVSAFSTGLWSAAGAATVLGAPLWLVVGAAAAIGGAFYLAYNKVSFFHEEVRGMINTFDSFIDHAGKIGKAFISGDFKAGFREWGAMQFQSKLNTANDMNRFDKERGIERKAISDKYGLPKSKLAEIERKRAEITLAPSIYSGKGARGQRSNRIVPEEQYRTTGKAVDWTAPNPVSGGKGISIKYNPIINISGPVTPKQEADFAKQLRENKNEIVRIIEGTTKRKEAKELK